MCLKAVWKYGIKATFTFMYNSLPFTPLRLAKYKSHDLEFDTFSR